MTPIEYRLTRIIQKIPIFAGLTNEQLRDILQSSKSRVFEANRCIFSSGEIGEEMLVLLNGSMVVTDDNDIQIATISPGEPAGELSVFTHEPRLANVTTTKPCKALVLHKRALDKLLLQDADLHVKVLNNLVEILTGRLRCANQRISTQETELQTFKEEPEIEGPVPLPETEGPLIPVTA